MTYDIINIFARVVIILLVLPFHELAHAFMAKKLGDNTAYHQGRITINPFSHVDPIGALFLLFSGFGWAKPVQVNSLNFKKPRRDMAIVALAGPVSNIIASIFLSVIYNIMTCFTVVQENIYEGLVGNVNIIYCIMILLGYMISINLGLAVFNLVPIPPLDGFNILRYFVPKADYWAAKNAQYIQLGFFAFILLINTIPSAFNPLIIVRGWLETFVGFCTDWIPALIGTI